MLSIPCPVHQAKSHCDAIEKYAYAIDYYLDFPPQFSMLQLDAPTLVLYLDFRHRGILATRHSWQSRLLAKNVQESHDHTCGLGGRFRGLSSARSPGESHLAGDHVQADKSRKIVRLLTQIVLRLSGFLSSIRIRLKGVSPNRYSIRQTPI